MIKSAQLRFTISLLTILVSFCSCKKDHDGTIYDIDGNQYHTVTIGSQTWMLENLKTTKYNDGSVISNITDNSIWSFSGSPGYCSYNNDDSFIEKYGLIYNWAAVKTKKLAPKGWHIPTDNEWQVLFDFLIASGYNYDGTTTGNKIAKSFGKSTDWEFSDVKGTIGNSNYPEYSNKSGFNALPGGVRDWTFKMMGYGSYWWCIYKNDLESPHRIDIYYNMPQVEINPASTMQGFAVRCIKD